MKASRPLSLATRLGLGYALGLAAVVGLGGLAVHVGFRAALEQDLRDQLASEIRHLRLAADDLVQDPAAIERNFFLKRGVDGVVSPLLSITEADAESPLFESEGLEALQGAPYPRPALEADWDFKVRAWRRDDSRPFRLASAWASTSAPLGKRYRLRLALSAAREEALLLRTRNALLLGGLLGALLAFWLGWALTRRGLRPLQQIGQAALAISPEQLRLRLGSQGWSAELADLAAAFSAMLAKLDADFERLRRHSAELSHELRTPLHQLRLHAEVLLSQDRDATEYRKGLEANLEELQRLSQTVDSVLFLARGAVAPLPKERVDAAHELADLAEFYGPAAEQAGLSLQVEGTGTLAVDQGLLRRALSNLLSNALRHSPRGGRIVLAAGPAPQGPAWLRLSVSDQGPGVPVEAQERVFEPFYRVPGQALGDGTGLGLALVRRIAELHNGRAFLEALPGGGLRVGLELPTGL